MSNYGGQNILCTSPVSTLTISMRLSKLEACLAVLKVMEKRNRITLDYLLLATKLGKGQLEGSLDILVENNLVTKRINLNKKITYNSTYRGTVVLSFFGQNKAFPIPQ